jgi:cytochrome c-type biogenesis protein CcmH/NrfG
LGLGNALLKMGRATEAAGQFDEALKLKPDLAAARVGLEQAHRSSSLP